MARKSFTLQKYTADYGSYVAYPSGSEAASVGLTVRADDDSRLKSDGLLVAPILSNPSRSGQLLPYISFFEAEVVDYNEVVLTWDAPLNDLSLVAGEDTVVATQIIVVYSEDGEPQTISDGNILVNDNRSNVYYHNVPSGKWAYYTLFVKFESRAGDLYYEPSAKLAVLTPREYGSADELYSRVPEYYRLLDGDLNEGDGGPLYRFLSIFGYEIDRVKTTVDHMMVMKDPQIANSQVLDYISQDLGIGLRVHELGTSRLRTLINIIGYLRRSEGTQSSLELAVQALTGSDVEIDPVAKEVKVYAQRVNLIKDPNLVVLVAGVLDGGFARTTEAEYSYSLDPGSATTWTKDGSWVYNPSDPNKPGNIITASGDIYQGGDPTTAGSGVVDVTQEPVWAYGPDVSSGGSVSILESLGNYIRVKTGDILYFSMQKNPTSGVQDKIREVKLLVASGLTRVSIASSVTPITIAGINYWKLTISDGYPNYISAYIYIYTDSTVDATEEFGEMLLEREIGGKYFDGDTSLGGWLVDSDTISDYRWYNAADPDSSIELNRTDTFSIYNSNYSKTRAVVHRMLSSYLPVTELTTGSGPVYPGTSIANPKWSVTFNHIPGVDWP